MTPKLFLIGCVLGALLTTLLQSLGFFPLGPKNWADVRADFAKVVHLRIAPPNLDYRHLRQ